MCKIVMPASIEKSDPGKYVVEIGKDAEESAEEKNVPITLWRQIRMERSDYACAYA